MKFKSSIKLLTLSAVVSAVFIGCGSDSSSGVTAPAILTGTFVDAPVQGLKYTTATQSGFTDENGNYKYVNGEEVEFLLGNLSFGKVLGQALVTPYTMAGDTDISNPSTKAKNIAMLLQNLDGNRTDTGKIVISALFADHDFSSDINLSNAALEASMSALLADPVIAANIDENNNTVITLAATTTAMQTYVTNNSIEYDKKFTYEYLKENSTLYFVFKDEDGVWLEINTFNATTKDFPLVKNGIEVMSYRHTEGAGTDAYEIVDGKIVVTTVRDGYTAEGTNTFAINSIDEEKITLSMSTAGIEDFVVYAYFDEAKALARKKSLSVSIADGFGAEWLDGKTLYSVILDTEDDNNNGSTTDWMLIGTKFDNGVVSWDFSADGTFDISTATFEIISGAIMITDDTDTENATITAVDSEKITVNWAVSWNAPDETNFLFYELSDAQAYLNSL